ncbi:MAG: response regulator transcription factor [Candidatus Rokubacteria bacterium]|nr:response regulator transcription factor [Candidatus Rokubacteria bacterium]
MRILIADDDRSIRQLLQRLLSQWGHEAVLTANGAEAAAALSLPDAPSLALLDWIMPELTGIEVCRRVRESGRPAYLLLVTAKLQTDDVVTALGAGADDYITKPFEIAELRARIRVGERVLALQERLAERVAALEQALAQVNELRGLLPICMYCKSIRNDQNFWEKVETYIGEHSSATFTHGICPECRATHVQAEIDRFRARRAQPPP